MEDSTFRPDPRLFPFESRWFQSPVGKIHYLDEGPRVLTNIVGVEDPTTDLACGQPVTLTWEGHEELNIPLFTPA